ncbi:LysR family transcriptional regulator [Moraxella sp. ZJ142]|uniref:LysR family transcriptional regulator n=1 Tax=Moraxella marmotae TaxID=3344520 RepID=UPI0035D3D900
MSNQPSLDDIRLFVSVVQAGSLSLAADLTGVSVSRLSRHLTQLEKSLGTQLVNRGKKGISLNELGERFFGHAQNMLKQADYAISSVHEVLDQPEGLLRISVASDVGHYYLLPHIEQYLTAHPKVSLDINLNQNKVNMIQDGIDIAIRVGMINNDNVVARPITSVEFGIYATPEYLMQHGTPTTPDDLHRHKIIAQTLSLPWWFFQDNHEVRHEVKIAPPVYLGCNDFLMVNELIVKGLGIGKMPKVGAEQCDNLVQVLTDWQIQPSTISAVYYKNRGAIPAVQSFVKWITAIYQ